MKTTCNNEININNTLSVIGFEIHGMQAVFNLQL